MRARLARGSFLLPIALATACASSGPSAARPGHQGQAPGDTAAPSASVEPRGSGPLTEAECDQLLDHYLDLAMSEKRATLPPDQVPTDEQIQRIRTDMRARAAENCIGKAERAHYECVMQAKTTRGIGVCLADEGRAGG